MKKKFIFLFSLLVSFFLFDIRLAAESANCIYADAFAEVKDPLASSGFLAENAEKAGGYTVLKQNDFLKVRIPSAHMEEYRKVVEESVLKVLFFNISSSDRSGELASLEARLTGGKDLLKKYYSVLDEADLTSALEIEKIMLGLVAENEKLKGKINKIKEEIKFAEVSIRFESKTSPLPEKKGSSFSWINSMDFDRFIKGDF